LPLGSGATADQGDRKRRNQVPDWTEIRCRFPPKSPAAFDRNRVPVCSDFCTDKGQFRSRFHHPLSYCRPATIFRPRLKNEWVEMG
jgi:hypothetical protein